MMVEGAACGGKPARFAPTPWTEESEAWQALDRRLPGDHPARRIARAVEMLDLGPLWDSYLGVGKKALRPDLLLKLVLYEMASGRPSPSQWARDARENEALRWLLRGMEPSRARLYDFRDRLAPFLPDWNARVLQAAMDQQVTTARRAALDSSSVAACASRRQLLHQERLEKRQATIARALACVARGEQLPDGPHWLGRTPDGLRRQNSRYRRAAEVLEERLAANARRPACDRSPRKKILVSPADPEALPARDKLNVFRPLYSVQLLRDLDSPLIFGYDVLAQNNDNGVIGPMMEQMTVNVGRKPELLLVDAGYISIQHLEFCERAGITLYGPCQENDFTRAGGRKPQSNQHTELPKSAFRWLADERTYRCPEGHRLRFSHQQKQRRAGGTVTLDIHICPREHCSSCPRQAACTTVPHKGRSVSRMQNEDLLDALRARMETVEGRQLYRQRCRTVELNYADLKEHRGLRRFHGRGRDRALAEVGLLVLTHNLLCVESRRCQLRAPPQNRQPAPSSLVA